MKQETVVDIDRLKTTDQGTAEEVLLLRSVTWQRIEPIISCPQQKQRCHHFTSSSTWPAKIDQSILMRIDAEAPQSYGAD